MCLFVDIYIYNSLFNFKTIITSFKISIHRGVLNSIKHYKSREGFPKKIFFPTVLVLVMSTGKVNSVAPRRKYWRRNKASSTPPKLSTSEKGLFHGLKITPPVNPPDATAQPWNSVNLQHMHKTGAYRVANLITVIRTQLDPTSRGFNQNTPFADADGAFRIQIRLKAILVWNLTGKVLGLSVNDFTSAKFGGDQLGGWVDCGGPAHFPAVGFRYPATHQNFVLRPDKSLQAEELFTLTAGDSDSLLIHIHLSWRFDGPIRFAMPRQIADIISGNVSDIRENQPSIVRTTLDGVAVAASVVQVLAANDQDSQFLNPSLRSVESLESRLEQVEEFIAKVSLSDASSETSRFEHV